MTRFIRFTGAALVGSLSLLFAAAASADFDFGDFVQAVDHFGGNHHYDNHHGGHHDDHYDNHHHHQNHNHHNHGGHGHSHSQPVFVDTGMPYPGLEMGDFGGMGHIHELAANVRYLANHITFDMYYNYQFNPGFDQIYAKCYSFRNLAYAIHDMEHTGQHVEMTAAINEMDSLFHSLEHDIAMWRRMPRLQIGQGDIRYKMELLEEMMHHLLNDAGIRSQFLIESTAVPPLPAGAIAPLPQGVPVP
jgi:hypothetical protein